MIDIKRQEDAFEKLLGEKKYVKLNEISNGFDYGVGASAVPYDGTNQYIRITDIDDYSGTFIGKNKSTPEFGIEEKYKVKENDILIARTGASVGKSYLYNKKDGLLYFAGFLIRVNIDKEISGSYVFHFLRTEKYRNFIQITSIRSGQPGINAQELAILKVPVYENYNNKLGEFLTSLDGLIQKQEEYIEELKVQKKAYSQKIFKQEIRFNGFNTKWVEKSIGSYAKVIKGLTNCFKENFEEKNPNAFYIQFKNIHESTIKQESLGTVKIDDLNSQNKISANDIVVTTSSENIEEVGTSNINKLKIDNLYLNSFSFGLRPININGAFLHYQLKSNHIRKKIKLEGQGITRINLSPTKFTEIKINVPTSEEQEKIGYFLNCLDENIELQEQKLEQLKLKKKYYLSKIFA